MRCQKQRIFCSANMFGLTKCMPPSVLHVPWLGGCREAMHSRPKCSCGSGLGRKTPMCCVLIWPCCVAWLTLRWILCAWRLPVAMDAMAQMMWLPMQRSCPRPLAHLCECNSAANRNMRGSLKVQRNSCKCAVACLPTVNLLATIFKPLTRPMVHLPWPCYLLAP